jgi:hypothetical protein
LRRRAGGCSHTPRQVDRRRGASIAAALTEPQPLSRSLTSEHTAYPAAAPLTLCTHAELGWLLRRRAGGKSHPPGQVGRRRGASIAAALTELQAPLLLGEELPTTYPRSAPCPADMRAIRTAIGGGPRR